LFTQNKLHREGDLLNVKLEGSAKTQMDTKIQVIKKLLARLEIIPNNTPEVQPGNPPLTANPNGEARTPASAAGEKGTSKDKDETNAVKSSGVVSNASPTSRGNSEAVPSDLEVPVQVDSVPTRVTERMSDGNYRVKGQQSFMIGKKEFRVIVTGLVRPEDFTDEGMSSNKLLDPQLDVVSLRRSLQ
jgi:flagellar L-ring protein precursor FlgH